MTKPNVVLSMKSLLVVFSYHHKNTEKIANIFAKVLDAQIKTPQQTNPEELQEYSRARARALAQEYMAKSITNFCLTLPINYHKLLTGKHSFSQPVESQENSPSNMNSMILTRRLGKNCNLKVT